MKATHCNNCPNGLQLFQWRRCLDTTFIDNLTDLQLQWLQHLKIAADRSQCIALPELVFRGFQARSWVDGTAGACKLTSDGVYAALRLLVPKAAGKSRRKH